MSHLNTRFLFLAWFFVASIAAAQQPHWYVLLEPGNERWYHCMNGYEIHELVTGYQDSNSVVEVTMNGESWIELWHFEADGDVYGGGTCFIDMPPELGKTWGSTWGEWNQYYDLFTIIALDEDSYAPNCLVIQEHYYNSGAEYYVTRWYADGTGLVHYNVSCAYCSCSLEPLVVTTVHTTWGHFKSLYSAARSVP